MTPRTPALSPAFGDLTPSIPFPEETMPPSSPSSSSSSPGVWANPRRQPTLQVGGRTYLRLPIRTKRIEAGDNLPLLIDEASAPHRRPGDVLFVSEKVVAVSQGRAVRVEDLRIGLTARLLWRCVSKSPYGIGLRSPSSMQCAVNECGAWRIWLAAGAGAFGKLLGRRGDFYRVAGMQAATIDAAGTSPMQMDCVILGPKDPDLVAAAIRGATGHEAAVVDVNDIGGSWVLGCTGGVDRKRVEDCLRDNPLGQGDEQTPFGILRLLES